MDQVLLEPGHRELPGMISQVVILKRIDGNPLIVVCDEVASIDTYLGHTGLPSGSVVLMRNGVTHLVRGNPLDVANKIFPAGLD